MKTRLPRIPLLLVLLSLALFSAESSRAAEGEGSWVQVALGYHGVAMDDINNTDFRWHDQSPTGFNLEKLSSGMALSFGLGYDLSDRVGYGLFWEHQYLSSKGNDMGMEADVNLAADLFTGRMHFNFVRQPKWRLGVAGALGYLVSNGDVDMTTEGASYGQTDITASAFTFEGLLQLEIVAGEKTVIQITGGWRAADIGTFKYGGSTATDSEGKELTLDYTGFTTRVGLKYRFGNPESQNSPNIH